MNDKPSDAKASEKPGGRDYSETLFLPQTEFPMRAGLPQREPEILKRWARLDLYRRLREKAKGQPRFILHDGPPYANGNIHIGHALNKILKDVVTRSEQMLGYDSNYVPGWDCHGLPIEWKIEEENYRAKNKVKPNLSEPDAMIAFRKECRAYAQHWLEVQREEFKRLGVTGRLGPSLHHHGLCRRGANRTRADEVRAERLAVSREQAGDVERGGEDRTRRGRGRVRGLCQRSGVGEVSGGARGAGIGCRPGCHGACFQSDVLERERRDLDHDALDAPRQSRDQFLAEDRLRRVPGHGGASR
jgi:hypothetical protein